MLSRTLRIMVSIERAQEILDIYGKAWVEQDVELVLSIFSEDAEYWERAFVEPYIGHEMIGQYWQEKVVDEQSDIEFSLTNLLVSGDTIVAEWDASVTSNVQHKRIHLRSVAILETANGLVSRFREYWHSEKFDMS